MLIFMLADLEDHYFYIQDKGTEYLMISIENSCFAYSDYSNIGILHNTYPKFLNILFVNKTIRRYL